MLTYCVFLAIYCQLNIEETKPKRFKKYKHTSSVQLHYRNTRWFLQIYYKSDKIYFL